MGTNDKSIKKPAILAPAGNKDSFLSAMAAGADAVYCGLKQYSARMEARNFSLDELIRLAGLAHDKGVDIFIALNTLLKPEDILDAGKLVAQLAQYVKPEALIIQDLSLIQIVRQAGFDGEIHLSTLANVSISKALKTIKKDLNVDRVVIPRELHIDEIKTMAADCPEGLQLEVFVHGALCYGVSGRCYWSSFLGGKSGLRGQCVQPCRREYIHDRNKQRFFSCRDYSLDVLAKVLLDIPEIAAWKIEGRKKGPHYVYYTTLAYRLLRDEGNDPQTKKTALGLLERALGRPGTHFFFLPQRPYNPIDTDQQTGSGLLIGKVSGGKANVVLKPREPLLSGDILRIGYENEPWHQVLRVHKYVPKNGQLVIKSAQQKRPLGGTPVFLIDRREKELMALIGDLDEASKRFKTGHRHDPQMRLKYPRPYSGKSYIEEYEVHRRITKTSDAQTKGIWISKEGVSNLKKTVPNFWLWLPPVIWPDEQDEFAGWIKKLVNKGFKNFVLNMPWQVCFFNSPSTLNLWSGPFCNTSNPLAVGVLKKMGFSGAIVSPELSESDYMDLPGASCLPLGIVLSGNWPFCVSRIEPPDLKDQSLFESPKREAAWHVRYDNNIWVFPNWKLDLVDEKEKLKRAGYRSFIHLPEPIPKSVILKKRPGRWNWGLKI